MLAFFSDQLCKKYYLKQIVTQPPKNAKTVVAYSYSSISACMQNHNDDTIKTSDTVLRKIYLSLY